MTPKASTRVLGVFALAACLSGCAGASTRFYTLDPVVPAQAPSTAYAGPPLRVDAVHVPSAWDRPELVREVAEGQIKVNDNDHWAAPLGELMRRALTQDLQARLPAGSVIFPNAPKPPGASGLVIDVLAISQAGGSAVMDVSWTVIPAHPSSGSQVASPLNQHTVRLSAPLSRSGVAANAVSVSALFGRLADRITTDLSSN